MPTLEDFRKDIDRVDEVIVRLLNERARGLEFIKRAAVRSLVIVSVASRQMGFDLLLLAGDGLGSRTRLGKSWRGDCNPNANAGVNDCLDAHAHRLPEVYGRCGVWKVGRGARPTFG